MKKIAIAVDSWGSDRLDVFGLGADGQMLHKFWNGRAWRPTAPSPDTWQTLGGAFTDSPAAVSWEPNRLDAFGLGADGRIYHKAWNGSAWLPSVRGWEPLGGVFNSPPAVVSWGPNRIDIFGLGTDNQMLHKFWNIGAWFPSFTGWESLSGVFDSPPAAVSWGENRLDIVGLGEDNKMYHKLWNGSAWLPSFTGWEPLGSRVFESAPAMVSMKLNNRLDRLEIFGLGVDSQMYHMVWVDPARRPPRWTPRWGPLKGLFNISSINTNSYERHVARFASRFGKNAE